MSVCVKRLKIGDLMILIGATAAGLAFWKANLSRTMSRIGPQALQHLTVREIGQHLLELLTYVGFCLAWAMMGLRIREDRHTQSEIAGERPGFISCLAIAVGGAARWILTLIDERNFTFNSRGERLLSGAEHGLSPYETAPVIIIAWITLWLSKGWSAEKTWTDRFGRALGIGFLIAGIAEAWIYT